MVNTSVIVVNTFDMVVTSFSIAVIPIFSIQLFRADLEACIY